MTIEPVRRSVTVKAAQARAFDVFTARMGEWWPRTHKVGPEPLRTSVLEPRVGGRWYEIGEGGTECQWGKVLAWEPPERVLLAWQLGADFAYDPDLVTEVEVRFIPVAPDRTRVELEHRNLERFGDKAETVRSSIDSPNGWAGVLAAFDAAVLQG